MLFRLQMLIILYSVQQKNVPILCIALRHPAIKTGFSMAGCRLGMRIRMDFGQLSVHSLTGQIIVYLHFFHKCLLLLNLHFQLLSNECHTFY